MKQDVAAGLLGVSPSQRSGELGHHPNAVAAGATSGLLRISADGGGQMRKRSHCSAKVRKHPQKSGAQGLETHGCRSGT